MFGGRELMDVINLGGGHGGGDPLLRDELFIGPDPSSIVQRMASLSDGIEAVLTGVAIYKSAQQGKPVSIDSLRQAVVSNEGDDSHQPIHRTSVACTAVCK